MLGGLCGWLGQSTSEGTIEQMAGGLMDVGKPAECHAERGCGGAVRGGTAARGDDGTLALIAGSPRWLPQDLQQTARQSGHGAALLAAWQRLGTALLDQMEGPFALTVLAPAQSQALLATDRMGRLPLFYTVQGNSLVFGSTLDAVIAHPSVDASVDPQSIYQYMYFHAIPSPDSIYQDVARLRPAHALEWRNGHVTVRQWWTPHFAPDRTATPEALGEELRDTLAASVDDAAGDATAAFLSGGLDSSSVAGMLARRNGSGARAYAIGFNAPGYDEMEYARAARDHFGLDLREYYVTPEDVASSVPRIASAYDQPFGNSSAIPAFHCARKAAESGITLMLAGDGGDEIFGGNPPYARQQIFELYGRIPDPLRRGVIEPLTNSPLGGLPGARKARSYVDQARIPLPDRLQTYNFLHLHDPAELFNDDFLAHVDPELPLARQRAVYSAPGDDATALHRMMYLHWQYVLADNDLCKVSRTAALAGVDVTFPMLDDRMVAYSCRIPPELQVRKAQLRCFYKDAMRGFLPDTIIQKKKHGFGLPFGVWMRDTPALQDMAGDALTSLRRHGWFREDFLDRVVDLHRREHAAYYGELVWVLMILGLWLDTHAAGAKATTDLPESNPIPIAAGMGNRRTAP